MKIVVTGATGQLGSVLCERLSQQGYRPIAITRADADFEDPIRVRDVIAEQQADWVVNCAAYTQVDKAEVESDRAYKINRDAARAVAEGVVKYGGRLLHVSTDYVFDGMQSTPYKEEDAPNPLNVYGRSKRDGEQVIRQVLPGAVILRTAWVYGAQGDNFVKTVLRLAGERDELRIVDDQIGSPSWSRDIATAIVALIDSDASGYYHYTNEGVASWYDFAVAILEEAVALDFPITASRIMPISTKDYPTPAQRPAYSVLDKERMRSLLSSPIPHWRKSLRLMLKELKG